MAIMTMEQWLMGSVDFNLTDACIAKILFERAIPAGTSAESIDRRTRQLCYADLLMYMVRSSVSSGGELITDGGWQHQKSAKNAFNRDDLRRKANEIYGLYEPESVDMSTGRIVMKNLY